jgi:bifunctional DNA-binding transcriptional regulator/antitoxin component of YhaV-PrlF toxin-antitoxin module
LIACDTAKRQVVLPKAMCERKNIRPGTPLRISEVGEGFYITPVPEPAAAELTAVFAVLDQGRPRRTMTSEDEARVQGEIRRYRKVRRKR